MVIARPALTRTSVTRTSVTRTGAAVAAVAAIALTGLSSSSSSAVTTPGWISHPEGWTAATLSSVDSQGRPTGASTLVMASPTAVQTSLGTVPTGANVGDLSNDGRRVVLTAATSGGSTRVIIVDTLTRQQTSWSVPGLNTVRFTNPSGLNLLVATDTSWQRRDLQGRLQATFPGASPLESLVQTRDGVLVVGRSSAGKITVSSNATGRLMRTSATPAGQYCQPGYSLSNVSVTVSCIGANAATVYRYDTNTGRFTSLSGSLPRAPYGYIGARQTAKGLAVAKTPTCGAAQWGFVSGTRWTAIPNQGGERSLVDFYAGATRAVVRVGGCGDQGFLVTQSTATGGSQVVVAGGTKNPGKQLTGFATAARDN
ncbi:hypothetical protein ACSDQ9_14175 [Aestuariimicrobium soli]|uniref:hypothetical protein n=1 Tax=Aestuariimicrobium soli TaxID=2035834 RepID=UPI003EBE7063